MAEPSTASNRRSAESKQERSKCASNHPVGISRRNLSWSVDFGRLARYSPIVGTGTFIPDPVTGDSPKDHVDDKDNEGAKCCECCSKRHENGSDTRVGRAAESEYNGDTSQTGRDGVENHDIGEVMDQSRVEVIRTTKWIS